MIFLFIPLVVGIAFLVAGFRSLQRKRLVQNIPTSKVRSIAMGPVEIKGTVEKIKALKSPISLKDCVYYRYSVEEYRSSGKSGHWVTLKSGKNKEMFYLRDDTGKVLVDMEGADINIYNDLHEQTGLFRGDPSGNIKSFMEREGIRLKFGFLKRQLRFTESFIAPGDTLYVLGTAKDNPYVEEATGKKNTDDILIGKAKGAYFTISDKGERSVLNSLRIAVGLLIGFGALLTIGGIALVVVLSGIFF